MMDEAHHLRQEWWKALTELISELNDAIVVSLTATPPYDVIGHEWQRYEALCGPIDEEISVPELVKSGTLCPHQDFVWAVLPAENDRSGIHDYDINVSEAISSLRQDKAFGDAISAHPWLAATEDESAGVFDDPEFTVAMLAYLHQRSQPLPKPILQMMDTKSKDLPALDRRWWQILVHRYLFDESWAPSEEREEHRDELAIRLRNLGLLWRHELRIEESRPVRAQLSITPSKIEACVQICQHERGHLEDRLRQVILTDFIRDRDDESHLLGACTVFRAVAMAQAQDALPKLALLTGRLVLIHESQVEAVRGATDDPIRLETRTADGVNGFVELTARGGSSPLVAALTRMLMQGDIHILVGTRALLGEGWDAPVVNSLVLASYVGSFMLSNQMRGRAIRKDPNDPNKASAIWHIVAVDPVTPAGMSDWEDMQRRFTTFVGLSTEKPVIESGLERLHIPRIDHEGDFDKVNTHAMDEAGKRGDLGQRWQ